MNTCDHGHSGRFETRLLPTSDGPMHGNIIVCRRHYEIEMTFRRERNKELSADCQFKLPAWTELKKYDPYGS